MVLKIIPVLCSLSSLGQHDQIYKKLGMGVYDDAN